MIIDDFLSVLLRIGEIICAAIVAGLTGDYLNSVSAEPDSDASKERFIYTEVVAAISLFFALIWLIPFMGTFIHWPIDFLLFVAWVVAFGLLVDFIEPLHCGGIFDNGQIDEQPYCQKWKADVAFCFLSALLWLASTLLGLWVMRGVGAGVGRRRWYRSRV